MRDSALTEAIEQSGVTVIAKRIGVTSQAVSQWQRVPVQHVLAIEELTGVGRSRLRPDIYPPAEEAA